MNDRACFEPRVMPNDDFRKIRVLMVEDDLGYQTFVRVLLQKNDFEFTGVRRLDECLQRLTAEIFDVIMLDLNLPDSHGFITFTKVQASARGTPILILTGMNQENQGLTAVASGAHDFLVKDVITNDALIRSIRYAHERKKFEESKSRLAAIQDFTKTLAHDLRIPLLWMGNAFSALTGEQLGPLNEQQKEVLTTLHSATREQLSMVQKLLDLYQYELSTEKLSFAPVDLMEILQTCKSNICDPQGRSCNFDVPEELPLALGDADALTLLFTHLFDNAVKFGEQNSPVTAKIEADARRIAIHIHNSGPAIPEEAGFQIFDSLWHGVPGKNYVPRTGIGLYLASKIASLHGFPLSYTSNSKDGTTMTVRLNVSNSFEP